eukprot:GEZU01011394.1.p1 GENE.GEZU01011394.1~~GEZU01011394.1.p1  ORF type:complete len:281 (-),score=102.07 GEZU01011394.1:720-1562(-)
MKKLAAQKEQQEKQAAEKQQYTDGEITIKEIRFRINTAEHDMETKLRKTKEWLQKGYHVKVAVFERNELMKAKQAVEMIVRQHLAGAAVMTGGIRSDQKSTSVVCKPVPAFVKVQPKKKKVKMNKPGVPISAMWKGKKGGKFAPASDDEAYLYDAVDNYMDDVPHDDYADDFDYADDDMDDNDLDDDDDDIDDIDDMDLDDTQDVSDTAEGSWDSYKKPAVASKSTVSSSSSSTRTPPSAKVSNNMSDDASEDVDDLDLVALADQIKTSQQQQQRATKRF